MDQVCQKTTGKYFDECTIPQREALLSQMDKAAAKLPPASWGSAPMANKDKDKDKDKAAADAPAIFFRRLKSLTVMAYFTSEKIGKEHLAYDPVPGPFIACMPLNGQVSWSGE